MATDQPIITDSGGITGLDPQSAPFPNPFWSVAVDPANKDMDPSGTDLRFNVWDVIQYLSVNAVSFSDAQRWQFLNNLGITDPGDGSFHVVKSDGSTVTLPYFS